MTSKKQQPKTQVCRKCEKRKPIDTGFYRQSKARGAKPFSQCRECVRDQQRGYQAAKRAERAAEKAAKAQAEAEARKKAIGRGKGGRSAGDAG